MKFIKNHVFNFYQYCMLYSTLWNLYTIKSEYKGSLTLTKQKYSTSRWHLTHTVHARASGNHNSIFYNGESIMVNITWSEGVSTCCFSLHLSLHNTLVLADRLQATDCLTVLHLHLSTTFLVHFTWQPPGGWHLREHGWPQAN